MLSPPVVTTCHPHSPPAVTRCHRPCADHCPPLVTHLVVAAVDVDPADRRHWTHRGERPAEQLLERPLCKRGAGRIHPDPPQGTYLGAHTPRPTPKDLSGSPYTPTHPKGPIWEPIHPDPPQRTYLGAHTPRPTPKDLSGSPYTPTHPKGPIWEPIHANPPQRTYLGAHTCQPTPKDLSGSPYTPTHPKGPIWEPIHASPPQRTYLGAHTRAKLQWMLRRQFMIFGKSTITRRTTHGYLFIVNKSKQIK